MSHLTVYHGGNVAPPAPRKTRASKLFHGWKTVRAATENDRIRVYFIEARR